MYLPRLRRNTDWWSLGPHACLHDGNVLYRRYISGVVKARAGVQHSLGANLSALCGPRRPKPNVQSLNTDLCPCLGFGVADELKNPGWDLPDQ
jgi:hypothetical protein